MITNRHHQWQQWMNERVILICDDWSCIVITIAQWWCVVDGSLWLMIDNHLSLLSSTSTSVNNNVDAWSCFMTIRYGCSDRSMNVYTINDVINWYARTIMYTHTHIHNIHVGGDGWINHIIIITLMDDEIVTMMMMLWFIVKVKKRGKINDNKCNNNRDNMRIVNVHTTKITSTYV